jgi:hypothetical protein
MSPSDDLVQSQVNQLFGVRDKNEKSTLPSAPTLSSKALREIVPEPERPLLSKIGPQLGLVGGGLLIITIVLKNLVFGTGENTVKAPVAEVAQASTTTLGCDPRQPSSYACIQKELSDRRAKDHLENQKVAIKDITKSPVPPKPSNVVSVAKVPARSQPPHVVERVRVVQAPSRLGSNSYRSMSQPQLYRPIPSVKSNTPPEQLWNELAKDGVTSVSGNNSFSPSSDPSYSQSSSEPVYVSDVSPVSIQPSAAPTPIASSSLSSTMSTEESGKGKLMRPIRLASDFDASQIEYEIKVTKAVSNIPKGATIFAQIDGNPSQSGLVMLRPTRSSSGEIGNLRIESSSGGELVAKLKGTGSGFGNQLVSILFGGARLAIGQALEGDSILNGMGQQAASGLLANGQSSFQGRQGRQPYLEVPQGTTVKITALR